MDTRASNGMKIQIDFIHVNKKWIYSAINCEAYILFEGVSTDHHIVSGTFRLSLRVTKKSSRTNPPYDWRQLKFNKCFRDQFCLTLSNRFEGLLNETEPPSTDEKYASFVDAVNSSANEHILKPKIKRRVPWKNDEVLLKRNE